MPGGPGSPCSGLWVSVDPMLGALGVLFRSTSRRIGPCCNAAGSDHLPQGCCPSVLGESATEFVNLGAGQNFIGPIPIPLPEHWIRGLPPFAPQRLLDHLVRRGERHLRHDPDKPGHPLGPEVGLAGQEPKEPDRIERRSGHQFDSHHHLITGSDIGYRVDRHHHRGRVAGNYPLDGGGREVLTVDPNPVPSPAGEVEPPVVIPVTEVTTPVPTVAYPFGVGLGVVVVPLEGTDHVPSHDLTDGLMALSLIHISEPTRRTPISYAV